MNKTCVRCCTTSNKHIMLTNNINHLAFAQTRGVMLLIQMHSIKHVYRKHLDSTVYVYINMCHFRLCIYLYHTETLLQS